MKVDQIVVSQQRVANVIAWIRRFESYADLTVALDVVAAIVVLLGYSLVAFLMLPTTTGNTRRNMGS
jgi:hypothetical protein